MKSGHIQRAMAPPWGGQRQDDGSEFPWVHANELRLKRWGGCCRCLPRPSLPPRLPELAPPTDLSTFLLPSHLDIEIRAVKRQGPSSALGALG